jgi:RNA:NAD 2'-phosphotransferase (TPT1/KptA family)
MTHPIVFQVQAGQMEWDGYSFFLADEGDWLKACVPPQYLALLDDAVALATDPGG